MSTAMINVKTKQGRVSFDAPRGGVQIPNDRFVSVKNTPWIQRLISVQGDLEVEKAATAREEKSATQAAPEVKTK